MCGRFSRWIGIEIILEKYRPVVETEYHSSYNVAPMSMNPVVRGGGGGRILSGMRWGYKSGDKLPINVRSENLSWSMYAHSFSSRRAIVPATGFYEWKDGVPYHITTGDLMNLGAIYTAVNGEMGFAIVTVNASPEMAKIHSRMPLLIRDRDIDAWLSGDSPEDLLRTSETALTFTMVSDYVNNPQNDTELCIKPSKQSSLEDFFG